MKFISYKIGLLLFLFFTVTLCSEGDRSPFYRRCLSNCKKENCTLDGEFEENKKDLQDNCSYFLFWNCHDECSYNCMWQTVAGYEERGYDIPKFHGKWPFKRLFGIQEPASAFASLLNLIVHAFMFFNDFLNLPIGKKPVLVGFWIGFGILCMNAWFWSMMFHTRDFFFTEFSDYACALSVTIVLFLSALIRLFHQYSVFLLATMAAVVLFFVDYVCFLYEGKIDYTYNMQVNMFFGLGGSVLWVGWGLWSLWRRKYYVWRLLVFVGCSLAALSLELHDFPPVRGWDAHALWHLCTVPLPVLLYKFVVDDIHHMLEEEETKEESEVKKTE